MLLRRHVRNLKSEPYVDEVELLEANPSYAHVQYPNGRLDTVSLRDLAPIGNAEIVPQTYSETSSSAEPEADPVRRSSRLRGPPDRYV